jgi:diguanylate cyclase
MRKMIQKILGTVSEPNPAKAPAGAHETPSTGGGELEDCRASFADVLENYGRFALDTDEALATDTSVRFAQLADHLRHGYEVKAVPGFSNEGSHRKYVSVLRFFNQYRTREKKYISSSLAELRNLVWALVQLAVSQFSSERNTHRKLQTQLGKLKDAIQQGTLEDLRFRATETITVLENSQREREQQQKTQFNRLGERMRALRQELQNARQELAVDGLTRLYNRSALDEHLERVVQIGQMSGKASCVMMLDIDHFKKLNDSLGHPAGDEILRQVSNLLVKTFPRKTDFVARYGGEEFTIVLEEDGIEVGIELARRLLNKVKENQFIFQEHRIRCTVSIGVAEYIAGESVGEWIARADAKLYEAKTGGRDRVAH